MTKTYICISRKVKMTESSINCFWLSRWLGGNNGLQLQVVPVYLSETTKLTLLTVCSSSEKSFNILTYSEKLDHCIMQFQGFDWLSGHGL